MDSNRFFVLSAPLYEQVRGGLDLAFDHPNGKAATCLPPAAEAPLWTDGRPIAAVLSEQCASPEVAGMIAQLTAAGAAQEITAEQFHASRPQLPPS